jgi:hypothetical protein
MPDEVETLVQRAATDIGDVRWASAEDLRRTARRRTLRSAAVASVAVSLVIAAVVGLAGQTGGGEHPLDASPPAPSTSSAPTVASASASTADSASATEAAWWIPAEAMLQPQDVGPGIVADNVRTYVAGEYPAWEFAPDLCPGFARLGVQAFQRYTFIRGISLQGQSPVGTGDIVFAEVRRYTEVDAKQVIGDVARVVSACPSWTSTSSEASTPAKPAHGVWTYQMIGESFAGDKSLLISMRSYSIDDITSAVVGNDVTVTYAVVRVGGLIVVVSTERNAPEQMKSLAAKAVERLCTAGTARC